MDLRERVRQAFEQGVESITEIAERFAIRHSCVRDWKRRFRDTGDVVPKRSSSGSTANIDPEGQQVVRSIGNERNDITLSELREEYVRRTPHSYQEATFCVKSSIRKLQT